MTWLCAVLDRLDGKVSQLHKQFFKSRCPVYLHHTAKLFDFRIVMATEVSGVFLYMTEHPPTTLNSCIRLPNGLKIKVLSYVLTFVDDVNVR
jgi:hypothetical protein